MGFADLSIAKYTSGSARSSDPINSAISRVMTSPAPTYQGPSTSPFTSQTVPFGWQSSKILNQVSSLLGGREATDESWLSQLGRLPGYSFDRPITTLRHLTGQEVDKPSPLFKGVPGLGAAEDFLGGVGDVMSNIQSIMQGFSNKEFLDALYAQRNDDPSAPFKGSFQPGIHRLNPFAGPQFLTEGLTRAVVGAPTVADAIKEAKGRGLSDQDIQDLFSGKKNSWDYGDALKYGTSSDPVVNIATAILYDPTNLILGAGLFTKAIKAGTIAPKFFKAIDAGADLARAGNYTAITLKGLAKYGQRAYRGYWGVAAGTTLTEAGIDVAGNLAGFKADQPASGVLESLWQFNRKIVEDKGLSGSDAFNLAMGYAVPVAALARPVAGAAKGSVRSLLGSGVESTVLKAISDDIRGVPYKERAARANAELGDKGVHGLITSVERRLALNEAVPADVGYINSIEDAALRGTLITRLADQIRELRVSQGRPFTAREIVNEIKAWHANAGNIRDATNIAQKWDARLFREGWNEWDVVNSKWTEIAQARGAVVLGVAEDFVLKQHIDNAKALIKAGSTEGIVDPAVVKMIARDYPALVHANPTFWEKFLVENPAPIKRNTLTRELNRVRAQSPDAGQLTAEFSNAERAATSAPETPAARPPSPDNLQAAEHTSQTGLPLEVAAPVARVRREGLPVEVEKDITDLLHQNGLAPRRTDRVASDNGFVRVLRDAWAGLPDAVKPGLIGPESRRFGLAMQEATGMTDEETEVFTRLTKLWAETWGERTGLSPELWYSTHIQSVERSSPELISLISEYHDVLYNPRVEPNVRSDRLRALQAQIREADAALGDLYEETALFAQKAEKSPYIPPTVEEIAASEAPGWLPPEFRETSGIEIVDWGDGLRVAVPGGFKNLTTGTFTFWDLWRLKGQNFDPVALWTANPQATLDLYAKMFRSHQRTFTDPVDIFNRLLLAFFSNNGTALLDNESIVAITRARSMEDIAAIAKKSPAQLRREWGLYAKKAGPATSPDTVEMIERYGPGHGFSSTTADVRAVQELAKKMVEDAQWFTLREGEDMLKYSERVASVLFGSQMKIANFGVMLGDPFLFDRGTIDRQMVKKLVDEGLVPEDLARKLLTSGIVPQPKPVLLYKGRGAKRGINPDVPEHLRDLPWTRSDGKVITLSGDYEVLMDALREHFRREITAKGLRADFAMGGYQWFLWDQTRRIFEPHTLAFPGAYRLPKMDPADIMAARQVQIKKGNYFGTLLSGKNPKIDNQLRVVKGVDREYRGRPYDPREGFLAQEDTDRVSSIKGFTSFTRDARAIIRGLVAPDITTAVHEWGHVAIRDLTPDELRTVGSHYGIKSDSLAAWTPEAHERFARDLERYLWDRRTAPSQDTAYIFDKIRAFMRRVYVSMAGWKKVNPEVAAIFDEWFGRVERSAEADLAYQAFDREMAQQVELAAKHGVDVSATGARPVDVLREYFGYTPGLVGEHAFINTITRHAQMFTPLARRAYLTEVFGGGKRELIPVHLSDQFESQFLDASISEPGTSNLRGVLDEIAKLTETNDMALADSDLMGRLADEADALGIAKGAVARWRSNPILANANKMWIAIEDGLDTYKAPGPVRKPQTVTQPSVAQTTVAVTENELGASGFAQTAEEVNRLDAEVSDVIPVVEWHRSMHGVDEEIRASLEPVVRDLRINNPKWTLKAAPKDSFFGGIQFPPEYATRAEIAARQHTALGEWLFDTGPLSGVFRFLDAATRPVSEYYIEARQHLYDEMVPAGASVEKVDRFLGKLQEEAQSFAVGNIPMFRGAKGLPAAKIADVAERVFDDATIKALGGKDGAARAFYRAQSRFWQRAEEKAAREGFVGGLSRAYLRATGSNLWEGSGADLAYNTITKAYYPLFRFMLDIRWHAMNRMEADVIGVSKYGPRLYIGKGPMGSGSVYKSMLASQDALDRIGAKAVDLHGGGKAQLARYDDFGFYERRNLAGYFSRAMREEVQGNIAKALDELPANDPVAAKLVERFGEEQGTWSEQLGRMIYDFDAKGVKQTIDDEVARLALDDPVMLDPKFQMFLQRIWDDNQRAYDTLVKTFQGNPERSNIERVLNSFVLFWPLSYQIKATKWLWGLMTHQMFGKETRLTGAAYWSHLENTHRQRMETDDTYREFMEANKDLFFFASMFFPVIPTEIGVSLNKTVRGALSLAFPDVVAKTRNVDNPADLVLNQLKMGPVYSYEVFSKANQDLTSQIEGLLSGGETPQNTP